MGYRLLADGVLVLHTTFIAFVVLGLVAIIVGGLLGWRWVHNPYFRLAHLAAILIVVLQAWLGIMCPLTTWESELRVLAGQDPYDPGGFIATWLRRIIFFEASPWVFTVAYSLFAATVLVTLALVPMRFRHRRPRTN